MQNLHFYVLGDRRGAEAIRCEIFELHAPSYERTIRYRSSNTSKWIFGS